MKYLKNVATLQYKSEWCIGCGRCEEVCPHRVFRMEGTKAILIDRDRCMECYACARNCAVHAIEVRSGVGCAAAIIKSRFGIESKECSCSIENTNRGCC